MKISNAFQSCIFCFSILLDPNISFAQEFYQVLVDSKQPTVIDDFNKNDRLQAPTFFAYRSYCCSVLTSVPGANLHFSSLTKGVGGPLYPRARYNGTLEPRLPVIGNLNSTETRVCYDIIPDPQDPGLILIANFDDDIGGDYRAELSCRETTLFGGFNTSVNDFNFLEITNTSQDSIPVSAFFFDSLDGGALAGSYADITPPANTRVDLNVHELVGPGVFGKVIVIHGGPPGSIRADMSQYRLVSSNPFKFELVTTTPFKTRAELSGR